MSAILHHANHRDYGCGAHRAAKGRRVINGLATARGCVRDHCRRRYLSTLELGDAVAFLLYTGPRIGAALDCAARTPCSRKAAAWARPQKGSKSPWTISFDDQVARNDWRHLATKTLGACSAWHYGAHLKYLLTRAKLVVSSACLARCATDRLAEPPNRLNG